MSKRMADYKRPKTDGTADYDDSPGNGVASKRKNTNSGRPDKKTMGNYAAKKAKFAGGIID